MRKILVFSFILLTNVSFADDSAGRYKPEETITHREYWCADKKPNDILTLNKYGDVTFNGKVVMSESHKISL